MYGYDFETWEVRNRGTDPKIPIDQYPVVQELRMVIRDEKGRFHGATNFRRRISKKEQNEKVKAGTLSVVGQGLRLVK